MVKLGDKVRVSDIKVTVQAIIGPVGREFVRVITDDGDYYWWLPVERINFKDGEGAND